MDVILALAAKLSMSLFVTQVVNALLRSGEFYCPLEQSGDSVAGATTPLT